jgi:thioesterase domain-containing protein
VFPFQPFARLLARRRTGLGLVDPTLIDDEPLPGSIEDYARRMLEDLRAVAPTGPYLLAGYSSGGLVAFEVARLLRASAQDVGVLLIDSVLPGGLRKKPLLRRLLLRVTDTAAPGYPWSVFGGFLTTHYRRAIGALAAGGADRPEGLAARLVFARARARAARGRYRPRPCPVPAILIRATRLSPRFEPSGDYGWARQLELLGVVDIGAAHGDLYKGANIEPLADAAGAALDRLEAAISRTPGHAGYTDVAGDGAVSPRMVARPGWGGT